MEIIKDCFEPNEKIIKSFVAETNRYTITNKKIYIESNSNLTVTDIKEVNYIKYEPPKKKAPVLSTILLILSLVVCIYIGMQPSEENFVNPLLVVCIIVAVASLIVVLSVAAYKPVKVLTIGISGSEVNLSISNITETEIATLVRLVFIAKNQIEIMNTKN